MERKEREEGLAPPCAVTAKKRRGWGCPPVEKFETGVKRWRGGQSLLLLSWCHNGGERGINEGLPLLLVSNEGKQEEEAQLPSSWHQNGVEMEVVLVTGL